MKTTTLPSLRVDPAFRQAAEAVLHQCESLASFMEQLLRGEVNRCRMQPVLAVRRQRKDDYR